MSSAIETWSSRPPSRFLLIRSITSIVTAFHHVRSSKGPGKELRHHPRTLLSVDEERVPSGLEEELAASSAGGETFPVPCDDAHPGEPPATGGMQRRDETALGAQREPVGGVLDVAGREEPAVSRDSGGTDANSRVRGVCMSGRLRGDHTQLRPAHTGLFVVHSNRGRLSNAP